MARASESFCRIKKEERMMMKLGLRFWIVGATLAIAGVLGGGCGSNSTTAPSGSRTTTGSVAVGLRAATSQESATLGATAVGAATRNGDQGDRGVPLESLALTIDKIRVFPAEHDSSESDDWMGEHHGESDGDSASVPIDFAIPPERLEVSALGESLTVLLAKLDLPDGKYSHMDIRITQADGVLQGGQAVQVRVVRPDSLLMVQVPFTVSAGTVTPIVLVVDLSRSVHEVPPGSGNYVLRPVLWGELGHGEGHWRGGDDGEGSNDNDNDSDHGGGRQSQGGGGGSGL